MSIGVSVNKRSGRRKKMNNLIKYQNSLIEHRKELARLIRGFGRTGQINIQELRDLLSKFDEIL